MVNRTAVNNFVAILDTSIIISLEYNPRSELFKKQIYEIYNLG